MFIRTLLLLLLGCVCFGQNIKAPLRLQGPIVVGGSQQTPSECGPPSYSCGLHDRNAILSVPHLNLGPNSCNWSSLDTLQTCGNLTGANTIVTQPVYGTRMLRLTDANTNGPSSWWLTGDDGLMNLFNKNDTAIMLKQSGGWKKILHFNSATFQQQGLSVVNIGTDGATWSTVNANRIYHVGGGSGTSKIQLKQTDITFNSNPAQDTWSTTIIKDLGRDASCFGANYTATWNSLLLSPGDDHVFTIAASDSGGQGTGYLTVSYDRNTSQCSRLNSATGEVFVNGSLIGTMTETDRFYLHESYQTQNPQYAILVAQSQPGMIVGTYFGFYIWHIGTTDVKKCGAYGGSYACDGHDIWGYNGFIRAKALVYHTYADPSVPQRKNLPNPPSYPDMHPSWNNNNVNDTAWFLTKSQKVDPTFDLLAPLPTPLYNELWMTPNDGSGIVSRQACMMSSGFHPAFGVSNGMCVLSQTGKYAVCATDGMGQFGSTSGAGSCSRTVDCRSEDIVVELR